jgi:hypothetical protein
MLQDPDLAVAVEAARGLRSNREDPSVAIPRLTRALSRAHLGEAVADAMSAYGVQARQAIPALVKAHPLGRTGWLDAAEAAMQHIGPPLEADIPLLCESLKRDGETRMVVANNLVLLGLKGKSAADALEAAAVRSIEEHVKQTRAAKRKGSESPDNSGRPFLAAECCAMALWDVTHDTPRFLRLAEKLAIAADSPIFDYYSRRAILTEIPAEDCRVIETMLRHSKMNVQLTALAVLSDAGPKAEPLKKAVLDLAGGKNAELSRKAILALAAMGARAGKDTAPVLLSKWRDGTVTLQQFADAAGRLEIRSPAVGAILEAGLRDKDHWAAVSCAKALCITAKEPCRIARLIIDTARKGPLTDREAIEALNLLKNGEDDVIPFLVEQIDSSDYWTRHDAISSLGTFGPKASRAITALEKQLADKTTVIRLKAAKSVFLISNKVAPLEKQLEAASASGEYADRHEALKTIAELKRSGGKFVGYPLAVLRRSPPEMVEEAIDALQAIGTAEAVAALKATAESSDWMLRSLAIKALRQVNHPEEKGGK